MANESLLSIIIPVHNTADVLPRCLDSILNQVNKCIDILIVDDCSTDNSLNIIKEYTDKYENIKYLSTNIQSGAGNARNIGLNEVKTKYVSFLDSDDWIDSVTYQKVIEYLEKNIQCEIGIFGIKNEYDSPALAEFKCKYEYFNIIDNRYALTLLCKTVNYDNVISSMLGNKIFKTDLLKRNNIYFMHSHFEDVYFTFLCFYYASHICLVDNTFLHYYQRAGSIMHSFSKEYIDGLFKMFYDLRNFLNEQECWNDFKCEYFSLLNKGIYSLINLIFATEQNHIIQKKYIIYLVEVLTKRFNIAEIINNLDIHLIKQIFNI